jgi:hypothetical protein
LFPNYPTSLLRSQQRKGTISTSKKRKTRASPGGRTLCEKNEKSAEFVARCQQDTVEDLKRNDGDSSGNGDEEEIQFDIALSRVRAMIETNNEIWQRCQPNCVKKEGSTSLRIYRVGYFAVDVFKESDRHVYLSTCITT